MTETPDTVVYFAASKQHVKIGFTRNVKTRFQSLQTGSPDELTLLGFVPGDADLEAAIHGRLSKFHYRGEWFLDCEDVRTEINGLCGRNVFEAQPAPPPAPLEAEPEVSAFEAGSLVLEDARDRMTEFIQYCNGGDHPEGCLIVVLPMPHRHLVLAAMKYAQRGFVDNRDDYLYLLDDPEMQIVAFKKALAFAEQLECHVEMICGSEYQELLAKWPRQPRRDPQFETNFRTEGRR